MSTCICILNYNSYKDTIECIDSLTKQTTSDFSIVTVDNASENKSVDKISTHLKNTGFKAEKQNNIFSFKRNLIKIYVLESETNQGFSSGNNIGVRFIKNELKSEMILFLNNDTIVPIDFVEKMEEEYKRLSYGKNELIALGANEYNYYTKELSHRGIQHLNLLTGLTFKKNILPSLKYICGACIMVDANAPLMDETYFLYYEDAQYSIILKQSGYKLYTTDQTKYLHKISATTSTVTHKLNYQFTSMWHFYKKNYTYLIPVVFSLRFLQQLLFGRMDKNRLLIATLKKSK